MLFVTWKLMKCWDWHVHVYTCRLKCRERWNGSTFKAIQKTFSYTASSVLLEPDLSQKQGGCSCNRKHTTQSFTSSSHLFTPSCLLISAIFSTGIPVLLDSNQFIIVFQVFLSTDTYRESNNSISHSLFPTFNASIERYLEDELFVLLFIFSVPCVEAVYSSIHHSVGTASWEGIEHS